MYFSSEIATSEKIQIQEKNNEEGTYILFFFLTYCTVYFRIDPAQHVAVLSKIKEKLREDGSSSSLYLEDRWESYLTFF